MGAAIASSLSLSLSAMVFFLKSKSFESLKFNIKANIKYIVSGLVAILLVRSVSFLSLSSLYTFVISGILYFGFYVLFLLLLKTFDKLFY